jgi:thiocyanate desulfurase
MSEPQKATKPILTEKETLPKLKTVTENSPKTLIVNLINPEEHYRKRQLEVTHQDHEEFVKYLEEKRTREEEKRAQAVLPEPHASIQTGNAEKAPSKLDRRSFLTVVASTAAVGDAATLGYTIVKDQAIPAHGFRHAGESYTEAQRHNIERELVNPKADIGGRGFGNWVLLMPTKLGGGTYAVDLNTGRALAWISYWTYGDFNPISHHLCAFPSADPVQGFEWVNSTQGGKNSLIYGIPTNIETPAAGFNIYRVRFDGSQMELMENVSETTGLGLGVHVTIDPKTAERYFVTDGQKDIAACFDRRTSRVITALKYDWEPNDQNLAMSWRNGGVLKISKIYPDPATGKFDYLGTKGQKIEWEMVPMGELFVEEGTIPGDDPHHLSGADGTIWHPNGRWAATVVRLCGGTVILDAEHNFEPVAFLQFNKDAANQYPVIKIDDDHWQVTFDKIFSPGHEIGFSPDGRFFCMMNNLRENNCSVFDTSDPDPRNWKKTAHIEDPLWRGKYPNPFHMVFSMDSSKLYLSVLHPAPASSGVMVVDTKTWTIKKEIQGIGPDMQTLAVTYDGKYVVGVFSGFQRLASGIAFIDAETDELVGIWPSNGGHHDCVIIPTELEHMKHTRSCTL